MEMNNEVGGCTCISLNGRRLFVGELQGFRVEVLALLLLVELVDQIVDDEIVEVADDKVDDHPVSKLFEKVHRLWLQDGLDVGPLGLLGALNKNKS